MIISHRYKFIFIKTVKTAGTSLEIALSKYCGPHDIISPLVEEDELKRKALGYPPAQNYFVPIHEYSLRDIIRRVRYRNRLRYFNHASARYIRSHVARDIWNSYFKFCFERDPWDKFMSWYYWEYREEPRPDISSLIQSDRLNRLRDMGWGLYTDDSRVIVDRVYTFEDMENALTDISERLGLDEWPSLPHAKGNFRKNKSFTELMSETDKKRIEEVFSQEIEMFGYGK